MKEKHYAYKITSQSSGLLCTHSEIEEEKMLDLLQEIQRNDSEGIYWIFKQLGDQPKEPLCVIDCQHQRIYYHYSGDVEELASTIKKLSK
ncbi:TPA: hypothetical protein ACPSKE_000868 [Legionella feeleii]|uniref:Uncharacterized protein n=1 Tax=Legionella feeleii TaxID=453 RepID=A0A0W0TV86_9GAMM|nr:hypothetical protein [Legionella feeleii]KTC99274.1 hypothetical protein Lfee_1440 [Legionella feeleii]SPX62662.1 Uncharacterised protein [Legionella feeleii]STX39101.1 Uncharacterised protein [Legionella feeleii]